MRAQLYTVPVSLRPSESPCRTADRQCSIHGALPIQWELRSPCAVCDGYPLADLCTEQTEKSSACSEAQVKNEYPKLQTDCFSRRKASVIFYAMREENGMNQKKLNVLQGLLLRYCGQRGMTDVEITGRATATAITQSGKEMHLTTNIYGDIMDDDTKKIIADGNVSHDIRRIYEFPTEWKDRKPSVVSSLREKSDVGGAPKREKPKTRKKTQEKER